MEKGFCFRPKSLVRERIIKTFIKNKKVPIGLIAEFFRKSFIEFNPLHEKGPKPSGICHINNAFFKDDDICFSGTMITKLYMIDKDGNLKDHSKIPKITHNVSLNNNKLIYNNTKSDVITIVDGNDIQSFEIIDYDEDSMTYTDIPKDHARKKFGRGLCFYEDLIIGGSSPSTISVYKSGLKNAIKTVNISEDIRNAIHGLEVYPYDYKF